MSLMTVLEESNINGIRIVELVIGLVVDARVITTVPGFDFTLVIHSMTKDETIVAIHEVNIPAHGWSINDLKQDLFGKFVLTAKDEFGNGLQPIRGKLVWSTERKVFMAPYKPLEIKYRQQNSTTADTVYVFDDATRRKYSLPTPERGWKCKIVTFEVKSGNSYRFLFEASKE